LQFSIGIEYALHCLLHLCSLPSEKSVGIKELAAYQGVSETYLSKVFTKLGKAGIVHSVPGANGGYELGRSPENITFWDVVEAIEGKKSLFQCAEIRQNEVLLDKNNLPDSYTSCPCLIKVVMTEAEEQMSRYLRSKTLAWLHGQVKSKIPEDYMNETVQWFSESKSRKRRG